MSNVSDLVQDLLASAHRCPEDVRPIIRQAARALDRAGHSAVVRDALEELLDAEPQPAPFPPPGADPRRVKCA